MLAGICHGSCSYPPVSTVGEEGMESSGPEGTADLRAEASAGHCEMSAKFEVGY